MISLGDGIAIAGVALAACPVLVSMIKAKATTKEEQRQRGLPAVFVPCIEHSGMVARFDELKQGQQRIDNNITRIFEILDERYAGAHHGPGGI